MARIRPRTAVKALAILSLFGIAALTLLFWHARSEVSDASKGRVFSAMADTPPARVALLLGTSPTLEDGRPNLFFEYRMDAAAALYHAGKIEHILASGANPTTLYDESADMAQALIERGVPAEAITQDKAGFRTLDSVVRAREVFGCDDFLIVSQGFHVRRALYLAEAHGISATGFTARDVPFTAGLKTSIREELARVKAVLDTQLLGTEPRFLGPPIQLSMAD